MAIVVPFLNILVESHVKHPETETPRVSAQELQLHPPEALLGFV